MKCAGLVAAVAAALMALSPVSADEETTTLYPFEWPPQPGWNMLTSYVSEVSGEDMAEVNARILDSACDEATVAVYRDGEWLSYGTAWPQWANDAFTIGGGDPFFLLCETPDAE